MLEFEWTTILWTVINLLVLYLFLRKFLFGRVNAVLEQRQALIQQALDGARAEAGSRQRLEEAGQQAARQMEDARTRMAAEREDMLRQARSEVASLALLAAAKAAGQAMDAPGEQAMVDAFLSEVGEPT